MDDGAVWRSIALTPEPEAPSAARRWLAEHGAPLLGAKLERAQLALTELVTNSIRHGVAEVEAAVIQVRTLLEDDRIRIEVADPGASFSAPERPVPRPPAQEHTGRGFFLVDQVTDHWGVEPEAPTRVWFELHKPKAEKIAAD